MLLQNDAGDHSDSNEFGYVRFYFYDVATQQSLEHLHVKIIDKDTLEVIGEGYTREGDGMVEFWTIPFSEHNCRAYVYTDHGTKTVDFFVPWYEDGVFIPVDMS